MPSPPSANWNRRADGSSRTPKPSPRYWRAPARPNERLTPSRSGMSLRWVGPTNSAILHARGVPSFFARLGKHAVSPAERNSRSHAAIPHPPLRHSLCGPAGALRGGRRGNDEWSTAPGRAFRVQYGEVQERWNVGTARIAMYGPAPSWRSRSTHRTGVRALLRPAPDLSLEAVNGQRPRLSCDGSSKPPWGTRNALEYHAPDPESNDRSTRSLGVVQNHNRPKAASLTARNRSLRIAEAVSRG
jgi:hypothetical protein